MKIGRILHGRNHTPHISAHSKALSRHLRAHRSQNCRLEPLRQFFVRFSEKVSGFLTMLQHLDALGKLSSDGHLDHCTVAWVFEHFEHIFTK